MIPIKTSIEDMEKLLGYMIKQIGWVEVAKLQKALGATAVDDRKIGAMAALGLLQRDGANLKLAELGRTFASGDQASALRAAIGGNELYRSTVEWIHYGRKAETTATEIGQYWESQHKDTLGDLKSSTLKDGAVCFGRIADGAGLGTFKVGRAGKETRLSSDLIAVAAFLDDRQQDVAPPSTGDESDTQGAPPAAEGGEHPAPINPATPPPAVPPVEPAVGVSASPAVHVNVEIHIAADATAETVKEIFKNMAKYVLDRRVSDDD